MVVWNLHVFVTIIIILFCVYKKHGDFIDSFFTAYFRDEKER